MQSCNILAVSFRLGQNVIKSTIKPAAIISQTKLIISMTEIWTQNDASLRLSAEKVLHRAVSAINIYNENEYAVDDKDLSLLATGEGADGVKAVIKGKIVLVHEEVVSSKEEKLQFMTWISLLSGLHHENFSKIIGVKHNQDTNTVSNDH